MSPLVFPNENYKTHFFWTYFVDTEVNIINSKYWFYSPSLFLFSYHPFISNCSLLPLFSNFTFDPCFKLSVSFKNQKKGVTIGIIFCWEFSLCSTLNWIFYICFFIKFPTNPIWQCQTALKWPTEDNNSKWLKISKSQLIYKICSTLLVIRKMKTKTTIWYH